MIDLSLKPHPDFPGIPPIRVDAEIDRWAPAELGIEFFVRGEAWHLLVPDPEDPARRDGLWQHTCFELFIGTGVGDSYYELNLSPSKEWAAYGFDGYRSGMHPLLEVPDPRIGLLHDEGMLELWANIDLRAVPGVAADRPWRVGLSAVLEDEFGARSYWALAHPPGAPDFHHRDCFALELSPPGDA